MIQAEGFRLSEAGCMSELAVEIKVLVINAGECNCCHE